MNNKTYRICDVDGQFCGGADCPDCPYKKDGKEAGEIMNGKPINSINEAKP